MGSKRRVLMKVGSLKTMLKTSHNLDASDYEQIDRLLDSVMGFVASANYRLK